MVERLLTFLNTLIPYDKLLHFVGGQALAAAGIIAFPRQLVAVTAVVSLLGVGKEVYDYYHPPHECSVYDWLATTFGAVSVTPLILITRTLP